MRFKFAARSASSFNVARAALDKPDGVVREVIFPVAGEQTFEKLVKEAAAGAGQRHARIHTVVRASYGSYYRRMLPKLLAAIEFRANNATHRPLLDAIEVIRAAVDGGRQSDRLARSTRDLLNTLAFIADREAGFRSLGDAWADTTTAHGRLMLTVLGGLAEFERDLIRARTGEGRERAKARGVKMGRKPKLTAHQRPEAIRRRENGEPLRDIARSYNVHNSTISRLS